MNEQQFKDHYVATFLATYMAVHYDDDVVEEYEKIDKWYA